MARKVYCAREPDKLRQFGYCRDNRRKCRQAVIALIVTPGGLPLGYVVLVGSTADSSTLRGFLDCIEQRRGLADRIW